jgi:hypothetical protein
MIPALADPVVAVTAKTAARPRSAARRPPGATDTLLAGEEAAACGTAAASLSPTTLEFTAAMVSLDMVSWRCVCVCVCARLMADGFVFDRVVDGKRGLWWACG